MDKIVYCLSELISYNAAIDIPINQNCILRSRKLTKKNDFDIVTHGNHGTHNIHAISHRKNGTCKRYVVRPYD